ncbi:hypothetical protein [Nocardioides sp. SYSU D00065]|uniref:hypothetical protein n=1 Tax=Nocardioides sp. SYSU D00065 TaxID=2817378 RepID=UPI001B31E19B|nr:hypothetical protein [Nocardioides sp. SYSU D00065]
MQHVSRRHVLGLVGAAGAGVAVASTQPAGASAGDTALHDHGRRRQRGRRTGIKGVSALGVPLIGMSAPAEVWHARHRAVGPGVGARRIFADLADGPTSQLSLVREAHAAGQLPVISYKAGGDVDAVVAGQYDAAAAAAAARLAAFDRPTAVVFWHEPHGDMTPAQYVAASMRILPFFKRDRLEVGPLLNGWLLDRQAEVFAQYAPDELLRTWDWFGFDTYESGTMESPGAVKPASRIPAAAAFLAQRGFQLPLGVGEYNGYSAQSITDVGNALLSTPNVWFGCLWNTTGGKGVELSGDRLEAFRGTLAKARARRARRRRRR